MNPEQWGEVKRIFHEAAELPETEQPHFVRSSSPGDTEITSEVLRLLRSVQEADGFLEKPAADLHQYVGWQSSEPLLKPGDFVARRFEILQFLSRGGMGEVYAAYDTDLIEAVALKTIRPDIGFHPEIIERFKQEVRHAREISHPNICRVHELFCHEFPEGNSLWLLSMELLSGPTLRERIKAEGPLAPSDALPITRQIVRGLEAAHALGLVHRDLKSSNVILEPAIDGETRAVITDFGLSLRTKGLMEATQEPGGMGTPGYMAPEQELGGEVGPKADQYALGAVMCEMLTGFLPRWTNHGDGQERLLVVPPSGRWPSRWEDVVSRCLDRDAQRRFDAAGDVLRELEEPSPVRLLLYTAAVICILCLLLIGGGVYHVRNERACRVCELLQLTPDTDESESPSLARRGKAIAYSSDRSDTGNLDIFRQTLPGGRSTRLTHDLARDEDPSIAPDGEWVAFRSEREGGGIYVTNAPGAERLLVARGRNPQISPDGKTVLYWIGDPNGSVGPGRIFRISTSGGTPTQIAPDFSDAAFPRWSPDGRAIVFSGCKTTEVPLPGCRDWWIASTDGKRIVATHALDRLREMRIALSQEQTGLWYKDGFLFSGGVGGVHVTLWTMRLDPKTWEVVGEPKQLLDEGTRDLSPSVAEDGQIAYTRITGALHVYRIDHASRDQSSSPSKQTEDTEIDGTPFIAEGGRWLVFGRGRGAHRSIWIKDMLLSQEIQLLSSGKPTESPIIDRSGTVLAYEQTEDAGSSIYVKNGATTPRRICRGCGYPMGWFDGARAFFYRDGLPSHIRLANPDTGETRDVLGEPKVALSEANWSPASEYLLFTEISDDRRRVFAVHMPRATGQPEGPWIPILDSTALADHPRWSGDGRTIFYTSNRDGFTCIYGQSFSPEKRQIVGRPFGVSHFHNQRTSIDNVVPRSFNLSVFGDSLYFNLGEQTSTIWTGVLPRR